MLSGGFSDAEFFDLVRMACDLEDRRLSKRLGRFLKQDPFDTRLTAHEYDPDNYQEIRMDKWPSHPTWVTDVRKMLTALQRLEITPCEGSALYKLSEYGAEYGDQQLESMVATKLLDPISGKARARLKNQLRRILARVSQPCVTLELNAFRLAFDAIYFQRRISPRDAIEKIFLPDNPRKRLFAIFKRFPVLARLWSELISQWRNQVTEMLMRLEADRKELSRVFFHNYAVSKISDVRVGLSDPHNGGRTVTLLQLGSSSIIYKPRSGHGEQEWHRFIQWMNARSFRPALKAAAVLGRDGYCWMEEIKFAPCKTHAAARRFYERLGGMIAVAYLLKTVDCHRDNVIASGEQPVLVDAETLGHLDRKGRSESPSDAVRRIGFLPMGKRSSRKIDTSVLGGITSGRHNPRIDAKLLSATHYQTELVRGFRRAWQFILGCKKRRVEFDRLSRRLCRQKLRWIYQSTANYDRIRRASIQPPALTSGIKRDLLIKCLCKRRGVSSMVTHREIQALKRFDVPYFTHKSPTLGSVEKAAASKKLIKIIVKQFANDVPC